MPVSRLAPHDLWRAWRFEAGVVLPLAIAAALYLRGARMERGVTYRQFICFWAGWTVLILALVSPLHPLGESLFSAHMAQHEILMLVAAPLLVFSRPLTPWVWAMPFAWRRAIGKCTKSRPVSMIWRSLTNPLVAWCLHAMALWLWHVPAWFQATLSSQAIHATQHASFLITALLFWWSLMFAQGRAGYGAAVLYLFTMGVHTSLLGALLTFTGNVVVSGL
jgi:putative membrane protein